MGAEVEDEAPGNFRGGDAPVAEAAGVDFVEDLVRGGVAVLDALGQQHPAGRGGDEFVGPGGGGQVLIAEDLARSGDDLVLLSAAGGVVGKADLPEIFAQRSDACGAGNAHLLPEEVQGVAGDAAEVLNVGLRGKIYQAGELVVLRVDDVAPVLFIIKLLHHVGEDDFGQHGALVRKVLGENLVVPVLDAEKDDGKASGNQGLPDVGKDAFGGGRGRDGAVDQVQDAVEALGLLELGEG